MNDVVTELVECFEDVCLGGESGRVVEGGRFVVVDAPRQWGFSYLLSRFAETVSTHPLVAQLLFDGRRCATSDGARQPVIEQASVLSSCVTDLTGRGRIGQVLGVEQSAGRSTLLLGGLDASGMFSAIPGGSIIALVAGIGLGYFGDKEGATRRRALDTAAIAGSRLARFSADQMPVVWSMDRVDVLDPELVHRFVTAATEPAASRVLLVLGADPSLVDVAALTAVEPGMPPRSNLVSVDQSMDGNARADLVRSLRPSWQADLVDKVVERTVTFVDVYGIVTLSGADDIATAPDPLAALDALFSSSRSGLSGFAKLVAWCGGAVAPAAVASAGEALGVAGDPNEDAGLLIGFHGEFRLADVSLFKRAVTAMDATYSRSDRRLAALRVFDCVERLTPAMDPWTDIARTRPIVALVRAGDLDVDQKVANVLINVAERLGVLGDRGEARRVAELVHEWAWAAGIDGNLAARARRVLGVTVDEDAAYDDQSPIEERVARVDAMLADPDAAAEGLRLVNDLHERLASEGSGPLVGEHRLRLAAQLVRFGRPALVELVLTPVLADSADPEQRAVARQVMACVGPDGELRLERAALVELHGTTSDPESVAVLAGRISHISNRVGDYGSALDYGNQLLEYQQQVLGVDHPNTLTTRNNIATWTGRTGDPAEALRLFTELLPVMERVFGVDHPDTLATRHSVAAWTGETGDSAEALRLSTELLPDRERVLGVDHPNTLATRNNIATWTGRTGDPAEALRLFTELLPVMERVFGVDHPDTLATRHSVAAWTGETGDSAEALRLSTELLPDRERVLGVDHPNTLATRREIAILLSAG